VIDATSIAARIEQIPVGKFHRRFIALVSLGGWFDFYDIYMMAYIGAALQQSGFLTLHQFTNVIAAGFLGMFTGTILFGMGSDRMGRRSAFVAMLLIYSLFTLAGAFAPTAGWLLVLRFFAGIGIGAELVVIDTYVSEMVPSSARGRYVAITQTAGFTAVPIVAILVRLLVPTHFAMAGWRWVMVIGSLGSALAWYFRRRLPESPRWLESRGRHAEAEQALALLAAESLPRRQPVSRAREVAPPEASETTVSSTSTAHSTSTPASVNAERASFAELWRSPYRRRTIMLVIFHALQTIGYYGFANWAPTFLLRRGVSAALAGVHAADRPRVPARTGDRRSHFGQARTQVDHRRHGAAHRRVRPGLCVVDAADAHRAERRAGNAMQQLVFRVAARLPVRTLSNAHARYWCRLHVQLEPA
jgi:putative MFS transporter